MSVHSQEPQIGNNQSTCGTFIHGVWYQFSQFCRPHGLQHARPSCPSTKPRVYSNPCPLSRWCHLILCRPFLLLPSVFPSIRVFLNESALHIRWPKYWSFSFNISPSNEHSDWSPLRRAGWISLQSKGLSRLFQHQSSKASILQHSAFFMVQLSHPYMTTRKTIALTRWTLLAK